MNKKIIVGQVISAQGLQGQYKIRSFTENPEDIFSYGKISIGDLYNNIFLKKVKNTKNGFLVKSEEIETRNQVDEIINQNILLDRAQLPNNSDTFYFYDLISMNVMNNNKSIGVVMAVQNYGSSDLLEVKSVQAKKNYLIPFTKDTIINIDFEKKKIFLKDIEKYIF